jgi:hypothetical protein
LSVLWAQVDDFLCQPMESLRLNDAYVQRSPTPI